MRGVGNDLEDRVRGRVVSRVGELVGCRSACWCSPRQGLGASVALRRAVDACSPRMGLEASVSAAGVFDHSAGIPATGRVRRDQRRSRQAWSEGQKVGGDGKVCRLGDGARRICLTQIQQGW